MNQNQDKLKIIEQNHLGHFTYFPKNLGFDVYEVNGITIINCGLKTSMFNIAYGAPQGPKKSDTIQKIKYAFNGKPFAWWIPQNQYNPKTTQILLETGLIIETIEHAMICDLTNISNYAQKTNLISIQVTNHSLLQDFIQIMEPYDPYVQAFYEIMNTELLQSDEKLFIGYVNDKPITIGILFIHDNSAAIFSLITREDERGKGYGRDMMVFLMNIAKNNHCHSLTLSASSDSGYRLYERLGFSKLGAFECFEYKGN